MKKYILNIKNFNVFIQKKAILTRLNLIIKKKEIHVLMGPNGSGKSTFLNALAGHPNYSIKSDLFFFLQKNLNKTNSSERSHMGLFLAFQHPYEICSITNYDFLYYIYNEKRKYFNKKKVNSTQFLNLLFFFCKKLKIQNEFLFRNINENFSGGEKKQNEILQMLLLEPQLILLDELDSGLDTDLTKLLFTEALKNLTPRSSLLVITHNARILQYLKPNFVHLLKNGLFIKTGGINLVYFINKYGYQNV